MSHDRGCYCGLEKYEYDDCKKSDCWKRERPMKTVYKITAWRVPNEDGVERLVPPYREFEDTPSLFAVVQKHYSDEVTKEQRRQLDEAFKHLNMETWKVRAGPGF